jgi:hypothetical protein
MLPQREPGNDWPEVLPPVREPGQDWRAEALPRLPSVRELATLFQAKPSPEPLPRRSLLKVKTIFERNIRRFYVEIILRDNNKQECKK